MTRFFQIAVAFSVLTLFLSGCGEKLPKGMPKPVPCEIVVTQEGKPLAEAIIGLSPADDAKWDAVGKTDAAGKAVVFTMDKYQGAVPGKYKVTVTKTEIDAPKSQGLSSDETIGKNTSLGGYDLVEGKYGNVMTTPLEIEVVKGTVEYPVDAGKVVRIRQPER